jgi:NAD(P)H-dependent FMN reductase
MLLNSDAGSLWKANTFSKAKGRPAAYISYGGTNGSRSIDQIRQVGTQLGLVDTNAVIEIRDIFSRNKTEDFEPNPFDEKNLKAAIDKLIKYVSA